MTALRQESIDMLRRIPEENVEEVYNFLVRLKPKEPQTKNILREDHYESMQIVQNAMRLTGKSRTTAWRSSVR